MLEDFFRVLNGLRKVSLYRIDLCLVVLEISGVKVVLLGVGVIGASSIKATYMVNAE